MSQRFYLPREQLFTNLGAIGAGWKLYTYETGTTTDLATYSNTTLTTPNANPTIADSSGRLGDIFVDDLKLYKAVLKDADDNTIWTTDPVDPKTFSIDDFDPRPTSFWGTTGGLSSAYTLVVDPIVSAYSSTQTFFLSFNLDCAAAPTLTYVSGGAALNLKKSDGAGGKVDLEAGDVLAGATYEARNDGTDVVILNPEHPANLPANTTTFRGLTYLPKQITISNGTDTDHDLDFTAGNFQFDDGSGQALFSALTKQIDATWAEGTGAGGLDTGSVANNTPYYIYPVYNPTSKASDILITATLGSPTTTLTDAAGFTVLGEYLGACHTEGSANIRNGKWIYGKGLYKFVYDTFVEDINEARPGSTAVLKTITAPAFSIVKLTLLMNDGSAGGTSPEILITNPDQPDLTPSASLFSIRLVYVSASGEISAQVKDDEVQLDSSSQLRYRYNNGDASISLIAITQGWVEYL